MLQETRIYLDAPKSLKGLKGTGGLCAPESSPKNLQSNSVLPSGTYWKPQWNKEAKSRVHSRFLWNAVTASAEKLNVHQQNLCSTSRNTDPRNESIVPLIRARIKLPLSDTQLKRSCQDLMKITLKIMYGHSVIIQINSPLHCYSTRLDIKRLSNCKSQLPDVHKMEGTNRQSSTGKTMFHCIWFTDIHCSFFNCSDLVCQGCNFIHNAYNHNLERCEYEQSSNLPIPQEKKKTTLPMDLL